MNRQLAKLTSLKITYRTRLILVTNESVVIPLPPEHHVSPQPELFKIWVLKKGPLFLWKSDYYGKDEKDTPFRIIQGDGRNYSFHQHFQDMTWSRYARFPGPPEVYLPYALNVIAPKESQYEIVPDGKEVPNMDFLDKTDLIRIPVKVIHPNVTRKVHFYVDPVTYKPVGQILIDQYGGSRITIYDELKSTPLKENDFVLPLPEDGKQWKVTIK